MLRSVPAQPGRVSKHAQRSTQRILASLESVFRNCQKMRRNALRVFRSAGQQD